VIDWHFFIQFDYQLVLENDNNTRFFQGCSQMKNIYLRILSRLAKNPQKKDQLLTADIQLINEFN